MDSVAARHAVELWAHDLEDGDLALRGDLEDLLDALVHLTAGGDVERRRWDTGAQRLDNRVAAGHELRAVVGAGTARCATLALRRARLGPTPSRLEAFLRGLALACHMPGAVLRARRVAATFEGLAAIAAGALGRAFLTAISA